MNCGLIFWPPYSEYIVMIDHVWAITGAKQIIEPNDRPISVHYTAVDIRRRPNHCMVIFQALRVHADLAYL